jgi:hypothetical protein
MLTVTTLPTPVVVCCVVVFVFDVFSLDEATGGGVCAEKKEDRSSFFGMLPNALDGESQERAIRIVTFPAR